MDKYDVLANVLASGERYNRAIAEYGKQYMADRPNLSALKLASSQIEAAERDHLRWLKLAG